MKTKIILLGGFLGAGKTTAMKALASRLSVSGKKVGLISNDQAANLVDTYLFSQDFNTREVSGSCFCCNFNGFFKAVESLSNAGAEIILAEPVGSCTDLASTIVRPLKKLCKGYSVAPLAVLADPARINSELASPKRSIDEDAAYIIGKQLEEADVVVLTKSDLRIRPEFSESKKYIKKNFGSKQVFEISSATGRGLDALAKFLLEGKSSGTVKMDVDYDKYADGEAALGWLNMSAELSEIKDSRKSLSAYSKATMQAFKKELSALKAQVGHAKLLAAYKGKSAAANLVSLKEKVILTKGASKSDDNVLIVNVRAEIPAGKLEKLAKKILKETQSGGFKAKLLESKSLTPGRPNPTHRL